MKRVKAFWNSIWKNDRRLVALCYAVFLAGSILASLYGFAEDAYQRARGNVAQTEISGAQEDIFALTDLEQEGDLYTSTSVDPRMELDLAAHGRARLCAARYGSGDVFEYGPRRAERVLQTAGGHGGIRRDLPGVGA